MANAGAPTKRWRRATAEKADPNFEMTYVYRGNVFAGRGQMPIATAEYQRALAINPNNDDGAAGSRDGANSAALDASRRQRAVPDSGRSWRHRDLPPESAAGACRGLTRSNEYVVFTNRETGPDLVPRSFTHAPLPVQAAQPPGPAALRADGARDAGSAAARSM